MLKNLKSSLALPELRVVWVLFFLLAVVFAISYIFLSPFLRVLQGGILLVVGAVVLASVYKAASAERDDLIERSELRSVLFGLEDALIVYSKGFKGLFFNPAAEKLFKLSSDVVLGHEFKPQDVENPEWLLLAQIIFPSLAPGVANRTKTGEYPQITDLSFADPQLELKVTTSPINDEGGNLLGFMKIIRNRTREVSLIRSKSEFLTVASHQLRTPVTDVNWAIQAISKDKNLGEESRLVVENALKASGELIKIIESLLSIAKIEEGHFGYNFKETDILEFINSVLARVAPMARRAGIRVYFDRPKVQLPKLLIDPDKLSLALDNLLENAVRYNIENGEVVVRVDKVSNQPFLEISVKDTGIGIPPEDIKKLFKKFFRAANALKLQTEGSGLGLYVVKNIVQAHGGRVRVESELGRGSTFYFTLPMDPSLVPQHEVAIE